MSYFLSDVGLVLIVLGLIAIVGALFRRMPQRLGPALMVAGIVLSGIILVSGRPSMSAVAVDPTGSFVYALFQDATQKATHILVIDPQRNRVVHKAAPGEIADASTPFQRGTEGVRDPTGTYELRATYFGPVASLLSVRNGKVLATFRQPPGNEAEIHPSGTRVYYSACCGGIGTEQGVYVVDTSNQRVTAFIPLPVQGEIGDLAIDPTGSRLYIVAKYGGVLIIDTATNKWIAQVSSCPRPRYWLCG